MPNNSEEHNSLLHECAPENGQAIYNQQQIEGTSRRSIAEVLNQGNVRPVARVETFLDLAVALSIHTLAQDVIENPFEDANVWLSFWLRVFFIHSIWSAGVVMSNIANRCSGKGPSVTLHVGIYVLLFLVAIFVKSCQRNDTITAVAIYLAGRCLTAGVLLLRALCPYPDRMNRERQSRIKYAICLLPIMLTLDTAPLVVALTRFAGDELILLWLGLLSFVLGMAFRIALAVKLDGLSDPWDTVEICHSNSAHLMERYSFIIIVLLGTIVLAATTSAEDYLGSISSVAAIFTAIGCFTLYFTTQVKGRTDACSLTPRTCCKCHQLHLVLFCTVPTIAVTFSQIILVDEHVSYYIVTNAFPHRHPQTLLSIAISVYLVVIAELEDLSLEQLDVTPLISKRWRVKFIMVMGILVGGLSRYYDNAMLMAALSTMFTSLVQLFFVQTV